MQHRLVVLQERCQAGQHADCSLPVSIQTAAQVVGQLLQHACITGHKFASQDAYDKMA